MKASCGLTVAAGASSSAMGQASCASPGQTAEHLQCSPSPSLLAFSVPAFPRRRRPHPRPNRRPPAWPALVSHREDLSRRAAAAAALTQAALWAGSASRTPAAQYPLLVALNCYKYTGSRSTCCGGILILPNMVATAAHCVERVAGCCDWADSVAQGRGRVRPMRRVPSRQRRRWQYPALVSGSCSTPITTATLS